MADLATGYGSLGGTMEVVCIVVVVVWSDMPFSFSFGGGRGAEGKDDFGEGQEGKLNRFRQTSDTFFFFSFFLASSGGCKLTKVRILLGIGYVCVSISIKTFSQVRVILPPFLKDFFSFFL